MSPEQLKRGGWAGYPNPNGESAFREDLTLIQSLVGSMLYEWAKVGDTFYVRRIT